MSSREIGEAIYEPVTYLEMRYEPDAWFEPRKVLTLEEAINLSVIDLIQIMTE